MSHDYRNIRGRAYETANMPKMKKGLEFKGVTESGMKLDNINTRCMYCGGQMEIYNEVGNHVYWRCFGIDEFTGEPCLNNPDKELSDPLTYDRIENTGNRILRFADWMPPRLI